MTYADLDGDGEVTPGEIIEENNYYPFGLRHKGYNELATENPSGFKYKFGGKELNDELGFEVYDFGARNYDPALGRWMNVDPLAEKFYEWTGYNYALNNPVFFIDPDGMESFGFATSYGVIDLEKFGGKVMFLKTGLSEFERDKGDDNTADGIETKFVNEKGETIANTDDGSNEVFVIRKENEDNFVKALSEMVKTKDDLKPKVNQELGEEYGYNLDKIKEEGGKPNYPKEIELNDNAWEYGYQSGYKEKFVNIALGGDKGGTGSNYFEGRFIGKRHLEEGKMNIFDPKLKNEPSQNYIKTNRAHDYRRGSYRRYSDRPIPLLIDEL